MKIVQPRWGSWGRRVNCPNDGYLIAFQLKVEQPHPNDGDDTAANDIRFECNNGETLSSSDGWPRGDWGTLSEKCSNGICGKHINDHKKEKKC